MVINIVRGQILVYTHKLSCSCSGPPGYISLSLSLSSSLFASLSPEHLAVSLFPPPPSRSISRQQPPRTAEAEQQQHRTAWYPGGTRAVTPWSNLARALSHLLRVPPHHIVRDLFGTQTAIKYRLNAHTHTHARAHTNDTTGARIK